MLNTDLAELTALYKSEDHNLCDGALPPVLCVVAPECTADDGVIRCDVAKTSGFAGPAVLKMRVLLPPSASTASIEQLGSTSVEESARAISQFKTVSLQH